MKRTLLVIAIIIAQGIPATAQSREKSLDRWLERDLVPFVQQQLVVHPRFKNETVMFVVLKDNVPAAASNALALSLRDRLLDAAVDTKGVSIGWQQGRGNNGGALRSDDCENDAVHYYIGIELTQNLDASYSVSIRALDLEDRNWVTGFGRSWRGELTTSERQAMRQARIDQTFLGERDVPFNVSQTDLLAAQLAHRLSCRLLQGREDEYVVATSAVPVDGDELSGAVQLISNNLASREALQLTNSADQVTAELQGKAHPIDGNLYQYWVTLTPRDPNGDLDALSSSAYIELPWQETAPPVTTAAADKLPAPPQRDSGATISIPNAGNDALLGPVRIMHTTGDGKSLLRADSRSDSIVFFLAHHANHGLVRLADADCRERTVARIARSDEALYFPVPIATTGNSRATETYEWLLEPDTDTYYAIAVTDPRSARQIANHIDQLPVRCSEFVRPGLQGAALREWLNQFAMLTARSAKHVDWRAVRVRDVM